MPNCYSLAILSDIHYASAAEQARGGDYEFRGPLNPFLRQAFRLYRHVIWMRHPLRNNGQLDRLLAEVGDMARPGLVHRLDKDTSGLIVAAKTAAAHAALVKQFQAREVEKTYLALVWGRMPAQTGEITQDIGRHPTERKKMSAHARQGKPAVTLWRVLQEFPGPLTLLELFPKTGRTHQLRVHLTALGHPIVGDAAYGGGAALASDICHLAISPSRHLATSNGLM